MSNVALIILADTESHADLGRAFSALAAAMKSQGDDSIRLVFDGSEGHPRIRRLVADSYEVIPLQWDPPSLRGSVQ